MTMNNGMIQSSPNFQRPVAVSTHNESDVGLPGHSEKSRDAALIETEEYRAESYDQAILKGLADTTRVLHSVFDSRRDANGLRRLFEMSSVILFDRTSFVIFSGELYRWDIREKPVIRNQITD